MSLGDFNDRAASDAVRLRLFELVEAVGVVGSPDIQPYHLPPAITPNEASTYGANLRPMMLRPHVRDAIMALDDAMRAAFAVAYQGGIAFGRSLLRGLASGEVSLVDFEKNRR